eukprot:6132824-Pleurochrysis_carterae.AAC.2
MRADLPARMSARVFERTGSRSCAASRARAFALPRRRVLSTWCSAVSSYMAVCACMSNGPVRALISKHPSVNVEFCLRPLSRAR